MVFDPVREFVQTKNAFSRERGGDAPVGKRHEVSNQQLISPSKMVPRTTWGDVMLFGSSFLRWADPDADDCVDLRVEEGKSKADATAMCLFGHPHANFTHTKSYKRAKALFEKFQPMAVLMRQHGLVGGVQVMTQKMASNEIYPFNEEFWGYGSRFAIARSAAGAVPSKFEIAIESIKEAIVELPDTLAKPFVAAAEAAKGLIPDVTPWVRLIKWTSVGGGLFLLYWYVLRPRTKKA